MKNDMERKEIEAAVREFLVDELEIDAEKIEPGAGLKNELGIDSLEIVDVVVFVEEKFGFRMKPEDFRNIVTFSDFCDFIEDNA